MDRIGEKIPYPSWWNDPYGELEPPLPEMYPEDTDDDNDDYFYLTTFGYIHQGSVQD
jgi:hypothetical protein